MQNATLFVHEQNEPQQSFERISGKTQQEFMMFKSKRKQYKKPIFSVQKPEKTFISIDQALDYVGDNSSYSKRLLGLFAFYWIWYGFFILGITVFVNKNLVFFCPSQDNKIYQECYAEEACKYDINDLMIQPKNSLANDFQLYCDRYYWKSWIISLIYISNIFSGFLFPIMSDRKGRKTTLIIAGLTCSISLLLAGFSKYFYIWMVLVFLAGMSFGGIEITGRVYLSEISGNNYRYNSIAILNITWAGSQFVFGFLYWINDYWRTFFVYGMGVCFMCSIILGIFVIDESPRFLLSQKKIEQTKQVLKKMTIVNRRPPFHFHLLDELEELNQEYVYGYQKNLLQQKEIQIHSKNHSLFKYYKLYILWGIYFFTYFGMNFSLFQISEILWLNVSLFGLIEMLGLATAGIVAKKFSQIMLMRYCIGLSSLFCLSVYYIHNYKFLKIIIILCNIKSSQISINIFLQLNNNNFFRNISYQNQIYWIWGLFFIWKVFQQDFVLQQCLLYYHFFGLMHILIQLISQEQFSCLVFLLVCLQRKYKKINLIFSKNFQINNFKYSLIIFVQIRFTVYVSQRTIFSIYLCSIDSYQPCTVGNWILINMLIFWLLMDKFFYFNSHWFFLFILLWTFLQSLLLRELCVMNFFN